MLHCVPAQVQGSWLWKFFRVLLVLISLHHELPEYKKAQQGLLDICGEMGALEEVFLHAQLSPQPLLSQCHAGSASWFVHCSTNAA